MGTSEWTREKQKGGGRSGGRGWRWLWQFINLVMCVFFVLAAAVNLNDPDPYVWITLYGVCAVLVLPIVFKPDVTENIVWKGACLLHIILCFISAVYLTVLVIDLVQRSGRPAVGWLELEEARELVGAVISAVWLLICRFSTFGREVESFSRWSVVLLVMTGLVAVLPLIVWSVCLVDSSHHHCAEMFTPPQQVKTVA